ncbi:MAG: CooT family nickel-binding protein [Archaeoglobaceae archaeon]
MCESKVVRKVGDKEEVIMAEAVKIEVEGDKLKIYGIFEETEYTGKINVVDLQNHRVVVE